MSNVIDMFGQEEAAEDDVKIWTYRFTPKDKTLEPVEVEGYLVVNSLFAGVAKDEGTIHFFMPFEDVGRVDNLGPVLQPEGAVN